MVTLERIRAEAERNPVRPGRALLTAAAGALWAVGWTARKAVYAAGWCWSAVKLGWQDAGPPKAKR